MTVAAQMPRFGFRQLEPSAGAGSYSQVANMEMVGAGSCQHVVSTRMQVI